MKNHIISALLAIATLICIGCKEERPITKPLVITEKYVYQGYTSYYAVDVNGKEIRWEERTATDVDRYQILDTIR